MLVEGKSENSSILYCGTRMRCALHIDWKLFYYLLHNAYFNVILLALVTLYSRFHARSRAVITVKLYSNDKHEKNEKRNQCHQVCFDEQRGNELVAPSTNHASLSRSIVASLSSLSNHPGQRNWPPNASYATNNGTADQRNF